MAGLTAARLLKSEGWSVVVLDKSRRVGGRMATRRIGASRLDHGTQFFTVRDARFGEAVSQWASAAWAAPWFTQNGHPHYGATGGMNTLAGHLAETLDVRSEAKVETIETADDQWRVTTSSGEIFRATALLLTPPAPQTADLLTACADRLPPEMITILRSIHYAPCFSLLVTLAGPGRVPSPGFVRPEGGPVEWIADNTQKGVSAGAAALTIHARTEFSRHYLDTANLDTAKDDVARILLEAAEPWFAGPVEAWQLHRWKYSRPDAAAPLMARPMYLFSPQPASLVIAGDGFGGPRLEGAFLSGRAAARCLVESSR